MIAAKVRLYKLKWYLTLGAIGLLLISNLMLVLRLHAKDSMTILVPTISQDLKVGTNFVGDEYLKIRADQIVGMLFSMRDETSAVLKNELLKQCDSTKREDFKSQIEKLSKDIKSRGYYYVFRKNKYEIDNTNLQVKISGELETYLNKRVFTSSPKSYRLSFVNNSGMVLLRSFDEVESDDR